jgi:hypothetical protein
MITDGSHPSHLTPDPAISPGQTRVYRLRKVPGRWGTLGRRDIWLRHNPAGLWEIEARETGRSAVGEYPSETQAHELLATLVTADGWRRVDHRAAPSKS